MSVPSILAGEKVSGADLSAWHDVLVAATDPWTDFTPTWSGLTVGNGTQAWRYRIVGKTFWVAGEILFGSTTAVTGGLGFNFPGAIVARQDPVLLAGLGAGSALLYDFSTPANRTDGTVIYSATGLQIYGPGGQVTATTPFTWAVSDQIRLTLVGELA